MLNYERSRLTFSKFSIYIYLHSNALQNVRNWLKLLIWHNRWKIMIGMLREKSMKDLELIKKVQNWR